MSLWEFHACVDGVLLSKGEKRRDPDLTDHELALMGVVGFEEDLDPDGY